MSFESNEPIALVYDYFTQWLVQSSRATLIFNQSEVKPKPIVYIFPRFV